MIIFLLWYGLLVIRMWLVFSTNNFIQFLNALVSGSSFDNSYADSSHTSTIKQAEGAFGCIWLVRCCNNHFNFKMFLHNFFFQFCIDLFYDSLLVNSFYHTSM